MPEKMFEWDEHKNETNIEKHGIDFEDAKLIFEGDTVEAEDERFAYGETRVIALGEVKGHVLVVVYTSRNDARRIISERKAKRHERDTYYEKVCGPPPDRPH